MVDLKRLQDAMNKGDVVEIATEMGWMENQERCDRPVITCACCGELIPYDGEGFLERCVRISRGDFNVGADDADYNENIKFERFLCSECWLHDEDLCRFFNKLGLRVR